MKITQQQLLTQLKQALTLFIEHFPDDEVEAEMDALIETVYFDLESQLRERQLRVLH